MAYKNINSFMKIFKLIILLYASILLFSKCEKDNCNCDKDNNFQLSADYLKQTIWKGRIWSESKGKIVDDGYVNIQFSTDGRGKYEYKFKDMTDRLISDFQFQISDKLIVFARFSGFPFEGDWLIKSENKSEIVLVKNGFVQEGVSYHMDLKLVDK